MELATHPIALTTTMLSNYVKIAWRNLIRNRGYTILNVTGLSIGMACCLLIALYVRHELRYDRFHENLDRIYRVVVSSDEDGKSTNANGAFPAGPALVKDFLEVQTAVRLRKMGQDEKRVIASGDRRFYEEGFFFADSTFFQVFTFPLKAGDPDRALVEPNRVVITERAARKYFPGEDAFGRTLSIDAYNNGNFTDYEVSGIVADVPSYSHLKFDFLASWSTQWDTGNKGWWEEMVYTYILLAPGASVERLNAALPAFLERYVGPEYYLSLSLQPLRDIHLHSKLQVELEPNGDIVYVYLFSAIAIFVLILACINFVNLATAQSARRAREVGVRKVVGAQRSQIARQFVVESMLLSLFSAAFALLLAELFLPVLNTLTGTELMLNSLGFVPLILTALGLVLFTGLMAGSYPALFLSRLRSIEVLKDGAAGGRSRASMLRKGLVVFQFAVSVALIVCTAVVYRQMQYLRDLNLGFQTEQIVVLPVNDELRQHFLEFREALMSSPRIQGVTVTEQVPGRAGNGGRFFIEGAEKPDGTARFFVDTDFNRTYGTEVVAGRDFSPTFPTDSTQAYVINEAFVRAVGWQSPETAVGKRLQLQGWDERPIGQIIGVVKDFQLYSLRNTVFPVVMNMMPMPYMNFISVRIMPADARTSLSHLASTWERFSPKYPFEYYFLDDDFARLHTADRRLGQVFVVFAVLAIFVACLGLFGLSAYATARRTKEIGIRKVFGASITNLLVLLSGEFLLLVALSILIAVPAAFLIMRRWLEGFAYQTPITPVLLILSCLLVLFIALSTVTLQTLKTAHANPVKALQYE